MLLLFEVAPYSEAKLELGLEEINRDRVSEEQPPEDGAALQRTARRPTGGTTSKLQSG